MSDQEFEAVVATAAAYRNAASTRHADDVERFRKADERLHRLIEVFGTPIYYELAVNWPPGPQGIDQTGRCSDENGICVWWYDGPTKLGDGCRGPISGVALYYVDGDSPWCLMRYEGFWDDLMTHSCAWSAKPLLMNNTEVARRFDIEEVEAGIKKAIARFGRVSEDIADFTSKLQAE